MSEDPTTSNEAVSRQLFPEELSSSEVMATTTAPISSYQQLSVDEEDEGPSPADPVAARRTLLNFVLMSVLFSANHGCVFACLALASARLGSTGAWQSGILYITCYTASALLGATYIVKRAGARNSMWFGMAL